MSTIRKIRIDRELFYALGDTIKDDAVVSRITQSAENSFQVYATNKRNKEFMAMLVVDGAIVYFEDESS